jgi:hypothetical protein
MKLSENTINILKNFSTINKAIEIKPGNVISTISPSKTVIAKAVVEENFETGFAIYELNKFLGALSLFDNPDLIFSEKYVTISENRQKIRYTFCDPSTIVTPPNKELVFNDIKLQVNIPATVIQNIDKALSALGLPEISIYADGESVYIAADNSKNPSTDLFSVKIADSTEEFKFYFKRDNFKILNRDYDVTLSQRGLANFSSEKILDYFIIGESEKMSLSFYVGAATILQGSTPHRAAPSAF